MALLPAVCLNCGLAFESPFGIAPGISATFKDCSAQCIRCGAMAKVLDGTFKASETALDVVRGSDFTRAQVRRLNELRRHLLEQSHKSNESVPNEVIDAITAIKPELGAALKLAQKGNVSWAFLMLLLYLVLARCGSEGGGITIDMSTHTHVHEAPKTVVTRVEDSILYYPHDPKKHKAGDNSKPAPGSPKPK